MPAVPAVPTVPTYSLYVRCSLTEGAKVAVADAAVERWKASDELLTAGEYREHGGIGSMVGGVSMVSMVNLGSIGIMVR